MPQGFTKPYITYIALSNPIISHRKGNVRAIRTGKQCMNQDYRRLNTVNNELPIRSRLSTLDRYLA
ncbi:hypothetical protein SBF1_4290020 [Candidatus Desulfosporosinus infrequens]|uniref:Uncharacterized protein n=1 Tax=Candidatus Desulfosporosinus infrequens TaxID=2043169 RepID=A0A2U3LAW3_9FIRM|nr:hypothetical protein SBF1_4290020 [Candidatus Desulfosporosinus infrequens]